MGNPFRIVERGLEIVDSPVMAKRKTITSLRAFTETINIGSIAADSFLTVTVTVTGVKIGDAILMVPPDGLEADVMVGHPWVSATDTVKFIVENETAAAIDPASADWTFIVLR